MWHDHWSRVFAGEHAEVRQDYRVAAQLFRRNFAFPDVGAHTIESIAQVRHVAVFRCPETRPDHHAYETTCWNDIRDWADHLAALDIKLWWGPGRHGPGNNLFFMVHDPQGYLVEISAEMELVPDEVTKRTWRHEERTLNLWGPGFLRS